MAILKGGGGMRGAATKARWANCEKAALALGVSKSEVFHYLYEELVQARLLDPITNNEELAVARAKELPGWLRLQRARELKIHDPDTGPPSFLRDIGMAFLFIRKAGGFENARALLDAAEASVKALEKRKQKQ